MAITLETKIKRLEARREAIWNAIGHYQERLKKTQAEIEVLRAAKGEGDE